MPNTREKLIELLKLSDACICDLCGEEGALDRVAGVIADHLIANGVVIQSDCQACAKATSEVIANLQKRFATDNNFGDKISPAAYKLSATDKDNNVPSKWIPVTERLPEKGEEVIVFGWWHEKFQPLMCYLSPHHKARWFTTIAGQQVYTVTHWMPLPEPPKEGAGNESQER